MSLITKNSQGFSLEDVMWQVQELFVISDIHLGPEEDPALDRNLAAFLSWIADREDQVTLVVAGDLFDFLIPRKDEQEVFPFDASGAKARSLRIMESHSLVFDALSRVACVKRHNLLFMAGNHDPELSLPKVRVAIEERLKRSIHWLVHGEAARFKISEATVSVEHGDFYDDWNRINYPSLSKALFRITRGLEADHGFRAPPGSELVTNFINELRVDYPWVDCLKPEREAVVPIINHFLPFKKQAQLRNAIKPWLRQTATTTFRTLGLGNTSATLQRADERSSTRARLAEWLRDQIVDARGRAQAISRKRLISQLRKVSREDGYFDISRPDDNAVDIAPILDHGTDLVVHGHTHSAKLYPLGVKGLYINTGTWHQLMSIPESSATDEDWEIFLKNLEGCTGDSFYLPTFAHIRAGKTGVSAELCLWEPMRKKTLAKSNFDSASKRWLGETYASR